MRHTIPVAFALALAGTSAAGAAGVTATYNVDVGPLTVTEVKLNLEVSDGEARTKARIKAAGVSRAFAEFGATAEAETRFDGASPQPVSYRMTRDQSDMRKVTTVSWSGEGAPSYDPPIRNAERAAKLDQAIAGGVVDPVTAVLRIGTEGANPCPSKHVVFDGREVYELALVDKGMGPFEGDAAWQGEVQHCTVRWTPIAGRAKDKGVPGDDYEVDFAPVATLDDGRKLWLPVQMSGKLKGMGFSGYLTKVGGSAAAD